METCRLLLFTATLLRAVRLNGFPRIESISTVDISGHWSRDAQIGQHRIEALNLMANKPPSILAEVFRGMTPQEEADHFVAVQRKRQSLTQGATFNARLFAGEQSALEIREAATAAGLTAEYRSGPVANNLRAFGTLTQIHKRQGKQGLERILKVCSTAWPNNKYQGAGPILTALEAFYVKYGPLVNDKRLASALSITEPQILVSQAHVLSNSLSSQLNPAMVAIFRNLYNKRLRNKLPE